VRRRKMHHLRHQVPSRRPGGSRPIAAMDAECANINLSYHDRLTDFDITVTIMFIAPLIRAFIHVTPPWALFL